MSAPNISNTNLEYFDGFEDYSTAQMSRYWSSQVVGTFCSFTIGSGGRNSSNCLSIQQGNNNLIYLIQTLSSQVTRTVGIAFKITSLPASQVIFLAFYDVGTTQIDVRLNTDGTFSVTRNGTVLSTTSFSIQANIFYYVEFSATINNTTGSYDLYVNTSSKTSGTGVNTRNTANNSSNQVYLGVISGGAGLNIIIDDLYIRKDSTFLGDIRVESKLPNANGSTNQWTPLSGSNFTNVADNPADDDTSYNSTATVGNIDLFSYPALASSGTIYAIMLCPVVEIDTSGVGQIQPVYRVSSTNYLGLTSYPSSGSYNSFPDIQGQNPGTSAAWTTSDITSTQFGLERTA